MEQHPTPPAGPRRLWLETGLVTLLMTAATAFVLRPLPFHLDHWTGPGLGDPLFLLIILKWNLHQFRLGVPDLLDVPFFHPTPDVLALSDHFLGPSLVLWPVAALVGPVAAFNLLLWAAYALAGASAFWLFRRIGLGRAAALFGALAFTFSPWRVDQSPHVQMLLIATVPPMLWCWDRLLRPDGRGRHAVGFVLAYGIQAWSSSYLGFMIHVPLAVLALLRAMSPEGGWRDWLRPARRRLLILTLAAGGALLVSAYSPYLIQDTGLELQRGDWSLRTFGATGLSLVTPSNFAWYWRSVEPLLTPWATGYAEPGWFAEKTLFAGFLPTLLILAALAAAVRRWLTARRERLSSETPPARLVHREHRGHRWRRAAWGAFGLAALVFVAADLYTWWFPVEPPPAPEARDVGEVYDLSLGLLLLALAAGWWCLRRSRGLDFRWPALRLHHPPTFATGLLAASAVCLFLGFPIFYEPAADLLPGFSRLRVPARFYALASLGLTFLAARTLDHLLRRLRSPGLRHTLAAVALALLAVELAPKPLPFEEIPREAELPEVDRWIGSRSDLTAYVELPFRYPQRLELLPMYHASFHWQPIVNGFSGYEPASHVYLKSHCCSLPPTDEDLETLRRFGVSHVLVRTPPPGRHVRPRYREWRRRAWAGELPTAREVYSGSQSEAVYELLPP